MWATLIGFVISDPTSVTRALTVAVEATPTDPIAVLTSLGVGGLVAMPVYLWQRDTAKQRDKAMEQLGVSIAASQALQRVVEQNTEAQKAATSAVEEMTELMRFRWPRER